MCNTNNNTRYGTIDTPTHAHQTNDKSKQVKTQRACSDYRKAEFPHRAAPITGVRHIGAVTAQRLKDDARAHLGAGCPLARVEAVADLQRVVAAADHDE